MADSRVCLLVAVVVLSAVVGFGALLPTSTAAGSPPEFNGTIPDLAVTAGGEAPDAYDFAAHFNDPDGAALRFELRVVRHSGPSDAFRNPYPTAEDAWLEATLNGTRIDLRSANASAWGHWVQVAIRASDETEHVESNTFNLSVLAPPVTNRTWYHLPLMGGAFTSSAGTRLSQGCTPFFGLGTLSFPSDAVIAEMSLLVGRQPVPPPEGPYNGTPPAPDPYASSVLLTAASGGLELLNVTVGESPSRVYLNMTAVNLLLDAGPHQFGMASLFIQFTGCADGGVAWLTIAQGVEWLVRLPPGADRSHPNPSGPEFMGPISDQNVSAGAPEGTVLDLRPFFADPDGDPLIFEVEPLGEGQGSLNATIGEGVLRLTAPAEAANATVALRVRARDPFGAFASSNAWNATLVRAASSGSPDGPPADEVVGETGGSVVVPVLLVATVLAIASIAVIEVLQYAVLGVLLGIVANRARRPSPLDHFARGQIYQLIKENPGIHFSEVVRRTEMGNGTVAHHLRVLDRAGHIRAVRDGTKTRFTATGTRPNPRDYGLSARDLRVLDAVSAKPGILQEELAEAVGMSRSRVSRAVRRLTILGLVTTSKQGRTASIALREEPPGNTQGSPE